MTPRARNVALGGFMALSSVGVIAACVGEDPDDATPGVSDAGGASGDGAGGDRSDGAPATAGFRLELRSPRVFVAPGTRKTVAVDVVRTGFGGAIQFGAGAGTGEVTISGVAAETTPEAAQEAQVTIEVAPNAPAQHARLQVTGVSGAVSAVATISVVVPGAAGMLDTVELAPATGGIATVRCGPNDLPAGSLRSLAVDSKNRIVVASELPSSGELCIARLSVDGQPDPSFGTEGWLRVPGVGLANVVSLAEDSLLLAGTEAFAPDGGPGRRPFLARILERGTLDPRFGQGGIHRIDVASSTSAVEVLPLPNGQVLFLGALRLANPGEAHGILLARLGADGVLDPTFGDGGRKVFRVTGSIQGGPTAFEVTSTGSILVLGNAFNGLKPNWYGVLVRFSAAGQVDTSFGNGGQVAIPRTPENGSVYAFANDLALDGSDVIVVGEDAANSPSQRRSLRRFPGGGTASPLQYTPSTAPAELRKVTVDARRRRIAGGAVKGVAMVERFDDVFPDPSFGIAGRAELPLGNGDGGVLEADGGPIAPDSGFFDGTGAYRGLTNVHALAFDADGRIVVAGENAARQTVLVRFWQ